MEEYTEVLRNYLNGRRNIKRKLYKFMSTAYKTVQNGTASWKNIIEITKR